MIGTMATRSLMRNPRTTVWTVVALTACAVLVTIFATISGDLGGKMSQTLRQSGANAIAIAERSPVTSDGSMVAPDGKISEKDGSGPWRRLEKMAEEGGAAMLLFSASVGTIDGKPVILIMADQEKLLQMTPYWRISGRRAVRPGECLAGRRVAELVRLKPGMGVKVEWGAEGKRGGEVGKEGEYRVTGIIDSGDEDEQRIFVPGTSAEPWRALFSYALLSIPGGEVGIEQLNKRLRARQEALRVKPLRQIVYGERVILRKVALLSGLSLLAVLLLTLLGVSCTVLSRVVERRRELALMQALGAKRRSVVSFLFLESALVGVVASVAGSGIGAFLSRYVFQQLFHLSVHLHFAAFFMTAVVTTGGAVLTGCAAAARALRIDLATALRGE